MKTTNEHDKKLRRYRLNALVAILLIILAGIFFLMHNLGTLPHGIYHAVLSWPAPLVIAGAWILLNGHGTAGLILLLPGLFFFLPRLLEQEPGWIYRYWPVGLILLGLLLLVKLARWPRRESLHEQETPHPAGDGFILSENHLGSTRHIVLAPVFEGARIRNAFGLTRVDLRRTTLRAARTYIDIESTFGAIEILAPSHWMITSETRNTFGEINDKRLPGTESVDTAHALVIRGRASFCGIEIKN
jgi:predicted membrane protein